MAYDYGAFAESRRARRAGEIRKHESSLRRFSMAEVSMQLLTRDEHWNQFLQVAQARLEEDRTEIAALTEQLVSVATADPVLLMALKLKLAEAQGRVFAREQLQSLPAEIVGAAQEAKDLLAEIA